jgi:hypothetical protein
MSWRSASGGGILHVGETARPACQYLSVRTDGELERADTAVRTGLARYDPYWGAQLVLVATVALDFALPERLTLGPTWLAPGLEALALGGLIAAAPHPRMRHTPLRRYLSMVLTGVVSAANSFSLILLCHYLLRGGQVGGRPLIGAGMVLWVDNVLLFGIWYWQMDGGGPTARTLDPGRPPDFLFVQMTEPRFAPRGWTPRLVDYLYTSFTNATAFSPTDTMPLTLAAKALMAVQSVTALVTIGLVVARAVNILPQ